MRLFALVSLLLPFLMLPTQVRAAACIPQKETIKGIDQGNPGATGDLKPSGDVPGSQAGDNSASSATQMIRYLCSTNPDNSAPALRIGFYRLDEALAGSIITATPLPELQTALGAFQTVDNDVSAEARNIFQRFGSKIDYDFGISDISWEIALEGETLAASVEADDTANARKPKKSSTHASQVRHIWYLSSNAFGMTSPVLVLKEISNTMLNTNRWPAGYKFAYQACPDENYILCTSIWRYINFSDFDLLLQDMRDFVAAGGTRGVTGAPPASRIVPDYERHFQLDRYLGGTAGLPPTFLSISSSLENGCGGSGWSFSYSGQPLTVDVAIVENLTNQPVRIDDFLGVKSAANGLRPISESVGRSTDKARSLGLPAQTLGPHAKLVLPMLIRFGDPGPHDQASDAAQPPDQDPDGAQATYEKIKSSPKKVFETTIEVGPRKSITVRKAKDSFGPAEDRAIVEYVFGPEMSLAGLVADGKQYAFQRVPPKARSSKDDDADKPAPSDVGKLSMSVSLAGTGESCPILYLRDEESDSWITLGKVLHEANGAEKEMTQAVRLPYLRTHFRLTEEEPEMSYIKDAVLRLTLKDERRIEVPSRQAYSRVIPAYTSIDMDFDLPQDVSAEDVVKSELVLTGYYERFNQLLSQAGGFSPAAKSLER